MTEKFVVRNSLRFFHTSEVFLLNNFKFNHKITVCLKTKFQSRKKGSILRLVSISALKVDERNSRFIKEVENGENGGPQKISFYFGAK